MAAEKTDRLLRWGEFQDLIEAEIARQQRDEPTQVGRRTGIVLGGKLYILLEWDLSLHIPQQVQIAPHEELERCLLNRLVTR